MERRAIISTTICGGLFFLSIILGVAGFHHLHLVLNTDIRLTLTDMLLLIAAPFPIIAAFIIAKKRTA